MRDDFTDLVAPHLPAMAHLAARLAPDADRDDVLQEALSGAWRKFGQYDQARGSLRNWLLAIVADQARKAHRRSHSHRELLDTPVWQQPAELDLERAVRALAPRQRLAVALHYFLDLPVAEVAAVMGCAEGTVKATLSQARDRLRDALGEDYR
ncbi:MAG: sigma-70 family RNA polymerase sigma factor [Jatrophihabitantaceae bacterium]